MGKTIKYTINELLGIGFTIVVLGIGLAYGINVTADIRDDFVDDNTVHGSGANPGCNATDKNACDFQTNATIDSMTGTSNITAKLPTIATVIVAAVIIGILVVYLWQRFARG